MGGTGRYTGCDLANVTPLCMPWTEDKGIAAPPFSQEAARLSLELAATAYDLKIDDWRSAGWHDVSYQVDNTLLTGPAVNRTSTLGGAISGYFRRLAHARIKRQNPISQLRGALRQRESSDTCKALVMLHSAPGGEYVVAIGFMGTGKRIYDWFSNFRLGREDGMHRGFLQLTREFEEKCDAISFPETALELGLDKLTLQDIFEECRRPGSRFHIWMAGHSQGGAVMQLAALRQVRRGLLRQNLIGYGFASPSVAYDNPGCDLGRFPLHHLINADDVTPRVGAALHIGACWVYQPDETMRNKCYGPVGQEQVFRALLMGLRQICWTGDALVWGIGLLEALEALPDAQAVAVINGMLGSVLPRRFLEAVGGRLDEALRYLGRKAAQGYLQITGAPCLPSGQVARVRQAMTRQIQAYGPRPFVRGLLLALSYPHKIRGIDAQHGMTSYVYMITQSFDQARKRLWCGPVRWAPPLALPRRRRSRPLGGRFGRYSALRSVGRR